MLFNGTVEYNIKYNDEQIAESGVVAALQAANATEFVFGDEQGLKREVGNRGEKLSGGQKQRLAIARCLARNPEFFLFDEATSALDSRSETEVQLAIEKASSKRGSVTIAHRLSTIKNCDVIYLMRNGKVREKGSYEELLRLKKEFYELAQN